MKYTLPLLVVTALTFGACNNSSNDAKKETDKANNAAIDSTSANNAQASQAKNDAEFLVYMANVGNFEIGAAKLAEKNSSSKEVKEFAAMMIKDHTELGKTV